MGMGLWICACLYHMQNEYIYIQWFRLSLHPSLRAARLGIAIALFAHSVVVLRLHLINKTCASPWNMISDIFVLTIRHCLCVLNLWWFFGKVGQYGAPFYFAIAMSAIFKYGRQAKCHNEQRHCALLVLQILISVLVHIFNRNISTCQQVMHIIAPQILYFHCYTKKYFCVITTAELTHSLKP